MVMGKESKTVTRYRDAKTGRLLTDRQGQAKPPSQVVRERVPKKGYGDTK